jgi:hypothetical protein
MGAMFHATYVPTAGMVNLAMAVTRLRDTGAVPVLDSIADYRAYLNGLITPPAQGQPEGEYWQGP